MTGLVLEGGAMRGLFTAGVLDVWMENGVHFDGVVGVSAGAVFGCNYKSHQPGRVLRYNLRFCRDWRYCSFRSLLLTGDLYGAKFCYHTLPLELDLFDYDAYAADPTPFYVVCTDVETGEAVYQRCDQADGVYRSWYRASASMPLASRPVDIEGRKLLDGGIADSIPIRFMESAGYEKNVIILTQPDGYVKQPMKAFKLMKAALRKYPHLLNALRHRHEVYNKTTAYIRQQEQSGAALVIRPPQALEAGHVERDAAKLQKAYDLGRAEGERTLEAVRAFLD